MPDALPSSDESRYLFRTTHVHWSKKHQHIHTCKTLDAIHARLYERGFDNATPLLKVDADGNLQFDDMLVYLWKDNDDGHAWHD